MRSTCCRSTCQTTSAVRWRQATSVPSGDNAAARSLLAAWWVATRLAAKSKTRISSSGVHPSRRGGVVVDTATASACQIMSMGNGSRRGNSMRSRVPSSRQRTAPRGVNPMTDSPSLEIARPASAAAVSAGGAVGAERGGPSISHSLIWM